MTIFKCTISHRLDRHLHFGQTSWKSLGCMICYPNEIYNYYISICTLHPTHFTNINFKIQELFKKCSPQLTSVLCTLLLSYDTGICSEICKNVGVQGAFADANLSNFYENNVCWFKFGGQLLRLTLP